MNKQVEQIYNEVLRRRNEMEERKRKYEHFELWGDVPELGHKINFANEILSLIESLPDDPEKTAAIEFVDAVSRYVEPHKGDVYCNRGEVLRKRDKLKELLK